MAVCVRPSVKSVSQSATIVAEMIKSVAARCSHMMSALRGERVGSKADDITDRLREWDSDKGEGVQKSQIFADVISEWSQRQEETPLRSCGRERLL